MPPAFAGAGLRLEAMLDPAREVGGDLVDHIVLVDGRHLMIVGDVSDKGAAAALTMARTHASFRALATRPDVADLLGDPARVADALNAVLCASNTSCMFVTALIALFDPRDGRLDCVRCGHVPPFVRRADGGTERLALATGLPLGVSELTRYTAGATRLDAGDTLLLLSDGVTEAENSGGTMFGDDRVLEWLQDGGGAAPALAAAVRGHEAGGPPSDDVAILLLHVDRLGERV